MSHGVISMLNIRRAASVSIDPSVRRSPVRERWVPTSPGEGDLRSRSYPLVSTVLSEDGLLWERDEAAAEIAGVSRSR